MLSLMKKAGMAGALLAVTSTAAAAQIYNTGVTGGTFDPFWNVSWNYVVGQPTGLPVGNTYTTPTGPIQQARVISPLPAEWQANIPGVSQWIGASTSGTFSTSTGGIAPGDGVQRFAYTFSTTILGNSGIAGSIGWDNTLLGYAINGGAMKMFSPAADFNQFGFCRNGDGEFVTGSVSCVRAFNIAGGSAGQKFEIFVNGDGRTDGLLIRNATIPEPSTYALMATGLLGIFGFARRRRNA